MAQAVCRRPFTAAIRVRARFNSVGFVVDKVALRQIFLRDLRFSPVNIIHHVLHITKLKKIHSFLLRSFLPERLTLARHSASQL
jgi:hypothetical protein